MQDRRLRVLVSGSAPLPRTLAEFFDAIGLTIIEGYGLTEASPALTVNPLDRPKFGTVGRALPGVELRVAEDGEIFARGPNIMLGYYNGPEATQAVLDPDGWLHTGDIGTLDREGYLTIIDRKKDLIVTSGGKTVAPQPIENELRRHPFIAEAILTTSRPLRSAESAFGGGTGSASGSLREFSCPKKVSSRMTCWTSSAPSPASTQTASRCPRPTAWSCSPAARTATWRRHWLSTLRSGSSACGRSRTTSRLMCRRSSSGAIRR